MQKYDNRYVFFFIHKHYLLVVSVELLMKMMDHTSSLEEWTPGKLSPSMTKMVSWKTFPASILGDGTMAAELT